MAIEEQKKEIQANGPELQERRKIENPSEVLQNNDNKRTTVMSGKYFEV